MSKRIISAVLFIFCISLYSYSIDAWIRINQLGYLPSAQKKAVFLSETERPVSQFTIHDALTNEQLGSFTSVVNKGDFFNFKSTYTLDFSDFKLQGAFYIKAGLIYSPTIYINKNIYLGTADLLLNFIRQSRLKNDSLSENKTDCVISIDELLDNTVALEPEIKQTANSRYKKNTAPHVSVKQKSKLLAVDGGWLENSTKNQFGSTTANAVFQLLFSYQLNPTAFSDLYDEQGSEIANGIPDVLDEAKWGLDWLLKMYPTSDSLFFQVADVDETTSLVQNKDGSYQIIKNNNRPVYLAKGTPLKSTVYNNKSTGIASIAGKYSSAFALGASILAPFDPVYADSLSFKALDAYTLGMKFPGVCQSIPTKTNASIVEDNWSDDMELAATELYRLTYDGSYLNAAAQFGRMEPLTPWLCSDTAANYQWFPFVNIGHYMLTNVENPRFQKEFLQNILNGIERMNLRANENPFNIGVPMIQGSNNLIAALATQCRLYRTMTNDSGYEDLENALIDWLFGKNPWGVSMVVGLPNHGNTPQHIFQSETSHLTSHNGALINGAVQKSVFDNIMQLKTDENEHFQSDWAVYHDDNKDLVTNNTSLDGTALLTYVLSGKQRDGVSEKTSDKNNYKYGGIIRTNDSKKQISLVFTGNEYADGYKQISKILKNLDVKASFFFTGNFYRKKKFSKVIKGLLKEGHYLGPASDENKLYSSFQNRDSMFVSKAAFLNDLKANFVAMEKFDLKKKDTPFFLPPFEWYNDSISNWTKEVGMQLVCNTPGTLSNSDNTVPEMRANYFSSVEIYNKILETESKEGLNGNILLFHIGTDKKRPDKFYPRLNSLLIELMKRGYDFVDLYRATDMVDKNEQLPVSK